MSAGQRRVERLFLRVLRADASVRDAIPAIDRSGRQIALVVGKSGPLLATVMGGGVRRGLLRGVGFAARVAEIMHCDPTTVRAGEASDTVTARIQGIRAGAGAVLGAGAVVLGDIAAGAFCAGFPAAPLSQKA